MPSRDDEPLVRDRTEWIVSAVAWTFRDYMSGFKRLLARKRGRIEGVYVPASGHATKGEKNR